ncbi:polo-like kinase [Pseudohyphozyma bogoriensis]|nr:polo-like kinase [Pseudohyphozyma bogoriensis]
MHAPRLAAAAAAASSSTAPRRPAPAAPERDRLGERGNLPESQSKVSSKERVVEKVPAAATATAGEKPKEKERGGKLSEQWDLPPEVIIRDGEQLARGKLLGEGGFARVYLATEQDGKRKALKVISKEQLKSTKNKSKLFGEIKIHQAMAHPNIISFEHCFEDRENVYMQLELCAHGSMLDTLRRRRRYSEPEARYYLVQLLGACSYMHDNSVIHRDLKLGNLMLDEGMNLRVGDFGLAALVRDGERKKTICGTPNYIAPEILFDTTNGHSFEVDIWSIGVILKIKDNNYAFPPEVDLSNEAIELISLILTTEPTQRPTLNDVLSHPFFLTGPFPPYIPSTSLTTPPDYRQISIRASHRNFHAVRKQCGISEEDIAAKLAAEKEEQEQVVVIRPGAALGRVEEEEEGAEDVVVVMPGGLVEPAPVVEKENRRDSGKGKVVVGDEKEARGMEKEVQKVLAPESPIADLLRSARKPLMVSPNAEPRELLQRKLLAEARATSGSTSASTRVREKETVASSSTSSSGSGSGSKENEAPRERMRAASTHRRHATTAASALEPRRVVAATPATSTTTTVPVAAAASSSKVAPVVEQQQRTEETKKALSTRASPRELYDATWRALDRALTIKSTADLEALPSPSPPEGPKVFVTSWVDYTHKYGTAYSLTDGSAGVYFNDSTTLILSPDKNHFDYIYSRKANSFSRRHYSVEDHPEELGRKTYLLQYFEDYMSKTLLRDVEWQFVDKARSKNMDFLVKYYRMKNAIVFKLSNDVLQFNFYDHTKLLLTEDGAIITFIDHDFNRETFSLHGLFREASRLGFYRHGQVFDSDPKRQERLEKLTLVVAKLEYCRDVLKSLGMRKAAASAAAATAAAGGTSAPVRA